MSASTSVTPAVVSATTSIPGLGAGFPFVSDHDGALFELSCAGDETARAGPETAVSSRKGATDAPNVNECALITFRARSAMIRDEAGANGSSADASSAAFGEALRGVLLEAPLRRPRRAPAGRRDGCVREGADGSCTILRQSSVHRLGLEGSAAREELVEDDAERPDVRARRRRCAPSASAPATCRAASR